MLNPYSSKPQVKKELMSYFYNPDFLQNLKNLLGGYNTFLMRGRNSVFSAYWIFEQAVRLCYEDDKKRVKIPDELYDAFMFLMYGDKDFIYDKKDEKYDFVPLTKLTRHDKLLRGREEIELSDTPEQNNYISGFRYVKKKKVYETYQLDSFKYNLLLDQTLNKIKPVIIKIELLMQTTIEETGYGRFYQQDSEFDTSEELGD